MSEVLRELVVALSLDSDNFSRNLRTINHQIKEAESTFRLAGAGIDKFEKSVKGTEAKLSMLGEKLTQQNRAVEQYSRALVAANQKLTDSYARQEKMKNALEAARSEYARIGQQVSSAAAQYDRFSSTLGESDSATIMAKENLEQLKQEYKVAGENIKKIEGQLKANSKTLQNNADAISKTTTDLNNAKTSAKETEAEIKKLTEALYRMESKWTQAGEVLTAFSKKCDTIGRALTKTGKAMTAAITAPIVALGATAIKASIDYESAFASVRKTVDATEEEFASLSSSIKQMSTEVASSANDIAEVTAVAGQLGIANDYLIDFTRTMIDLGNSTDIVAQDAAATVAKFANITSMDQSEFGNLGSALVDLGNNYATTESAIMEMSLRLAGAGHQVGLSEAQILGFAAALSSVGIESQMGGSAFSKALVKMEVASATGGDALKDFATVSGMTAQEFKALWDSDPAGAFQAFIVGLSKMDDEGESAIATLEEIGIKEVRLRDTLLRATNATELFSKTQATANAAWEENTALTEEAGKRYATTKSKLTNLKNTALLFAQQIGDDMNPMIQQLIDKGHEMLASFLGMDESQRMAIIRFAGFAAAAGPAVLVMGKTATAISKVTGVLGKVSTGLGKFSASVQTAGGGLGGFVKTLGSSKLAVAGLTAAVIYGAVQWIDYASGAKAARDALEGMNRTADEWRRNQAETIYSNDGLEAFGLSKDTFAQSLQTAEQWRDQILALWSDGKPETEEMIASYADAFIQLNEGTRTALEGMRDRAAESGHTSLSHSLQEDIDALDAMDQEIEDLLNKRRNKNLTGTDKIRLDELIEQREAIQIKYKLTPEDTQGYAQITRGIEDAVARAQAKGESGASVEVYEQGLTAAAQGYAAVTGEIDRQYDSERALIALIDDNEEKRAAYEALDEQYRTNRLTATQEYAAALRQIVSPVWEEEGIQQASADMDKLFLLFQQYSASGEEGAKDPALLEQMNTLFEGMDEGELISYLGLLQQVQGLLDGGMTEGEVNEMFPEMDMTGNINELAALADFAKERSGELSGLSTILNDLVPEEMKKIAVDLDMTAAEARWATFAEDPGAITTDAVIESYSEAETATKIQPVVDALVQSFSEVEGGASTAALTPDDVVAKIASYMETEGGADISALSVDQMKAVVTAYSEATGADRTQLLQALTAKIAAYDDSAAAKPSPPAMLTITGYDLAAYNTFMEEHPVEVKGIVRLGEKYENPEDALNDPDAQFYLNGQQIPVDIVPKEKISADTLFVYEEDGTMHVLITPELRGTPESVAEAEAPLNDKSMFLGGVLDATTLEWLATAEARLRHINEEGNTWKYLWGASVSGSIKGAVEPLENVKVEDWAAVQTFVQETIAALANGETLDAGVISDLQTITSLMQMLETFNLQNNVTAGIGSAMEGAGWTMDADTVAANLQAVVDAAKGVGADAAAGIGAGMAGADMSTGASSVATNTEEALRAPGAFDSSSPANRTKPVGRDVAAGVGAGMAEYDLSYSAAALATKVSSGLTTALSGGTIKSIGRNAMVGLGLGILSGKASVVTAIRIVANSAVAAAKEALKIQSPSRVFRDEIGAMAMRGFGEGVLRETESQARAIRNATRYLTGEAQTGVSNNFAYDNRRTYNQHASSTIQVERLYVRDEQDVRSLAIEIAQLTKRQQAAVGIR